MKIVHVAPDFYPVPPQKYGGIERIIHSLIEESVRRGHEVYLYAREGSETSASLIPYHHPAGNPDLIADYVLHTLPDGIDIIHDHTHLSVIGRKLPSVPTVCTIHDSLNNEIEHPVYVSQRALEVIGNNHGYYVYNGIDVEEYPVQHKKEDYLLFLGVLSQHKGIHHALDLAEKTKQRMIIAGPVFHHDYFRTEIEPRIQAMSHVEFVGEVGGEERLKLLQQARCLLFPTSWEEPFGLVMVEAMACGTPVIALGNGAVPEVLHSYPEFICRSVEEMREKLDRLHYHSDALRKYVADHFSVKQMADGYFDVYEQAIRRGKELAETTDWIQKGKKLKERMRYEKAIELYEGILISPTTSKEDKIAACNEAADVYYRQANKDKEREYAFRSFLYAPPRAEICCRLGYQFLQLNRLEQAIFWYKEATKAKRPEVETVLYYEACWTWLPHIQLCICYYQLGDYKSAYDHNEQAMRYEPHNEYGLNNKKMLDKLLGKSSAPAKTLNEVTLLDVDGNPFKMLLQTPGFIEEMIILRGNWEPHLAPMLRSFIKKDYLFLDIGANIGYHSLHVASLCRDARCISFEPHPSIYQQLSANVSLNPFVNIEVYPLAVGETPGRTRFFMQKEDSYNRGMSAVEYYDGLGGEYSEIEVTMTSLDSFLDKENQKKVSVIKIDTQGNEYQVLKGARSVINESKPLIALEDHNNAKHSIEDILKLLEGYAAYKVNLWDGRVTEYRNELDQFQDDYLLIPVHLVKRFLAERAG
ncbi:FkbM family methyltransferase [Paenibacillus timonensis]|uniref:FkbM family methyltransferase n=1 Tax=Paenibacillus timonensis TaxID=225915 RepID=UPI003F987334